jgi:hypothetical protein
MAACHLVVGMDDYPKQAACYLKEDPDRWRVVFVYVDEATGRRHFETASFEEISESQARSTAGALAAPWSTCPDGLRLERAEVRLGRFEQRAAEVVWVDEGPTRIGELTDARQLTWRPKTEPVTGLEGQQCLAI